MFKRKTFHKRYVCRWHSNSTLNFIFYLFYFSSVQIQKKNDPHMRFPFLRIVLLSPFWMPFFFSLLISRNSFPPRCASKNSLCAVLIHFFVSMSEMKCFTQSNNKKKFLRQKMNKKKKFNLYEAAIFHFFTIWNAEI